MHTLRQFFIRRIAGRSAPDATRRQRYARARSIRPLAAALGLMLVLGACIEGDILTGPGGADRRIEGVWQRTEQVNDAWWGSAIVETTWRFRRNSADYTEIIADYSGRPYERFDATASWYADDRSRDRIVLDYYDPPGLGRVSVRYDIRTSGREDILYLDGLRFVRVGY